jgi:thiamine biosynthesis protein ThiS
MKLIVNSNEIEFKKKVSLKEVIEFLKLKNTMMAIAVNTTIIKKEKWGEFYPKDGDKIEIFTFVGGG